MAFYSLVLYAGNGSSRNFTIHFPYLDKSHVKAKIDNAPTTAFSWLTDSAIQFNTAPAAGSSIEIYRETPLNASPVDFTDGSILLERDLDLLTTFNLYVDQELTDRASRALSAGAQGGDSSANAAAAAQAAAAQAAAAAANSGAVKVSNTDKSFDTLNNKLTVVAPLSKTVKDVGATEKLELSIDLSAYALKGETNGGAGGDMSGYATLKANTFTGVQTMPSLTVKDSSSPGSALITLQSSNDSTRDAQCGVRYLSQSGDVKYKHYYTSEKVAWHLLTDYDSTYRWCIGIPFDVATAASLKLNTDQEENPKHYSFNVGDPYNQTYGAAVNIYGVEAWGRIPKLSMYNTNVYCGGLAASTFDMSLTVPGRYTLRGLDGNVYCDATKETTRFFFSRTSNILYLATDGDMVLMREGNIVWSVNNYITSDVRLKTDIKPLEGSSLEKVKQLSAKTYLWKNDLMGKGEKREIGFIAQEVVEVVPEAVSKMSSEAETIGVAYTQLIPLLVEAVKELSAKVETLEAHLQTKEECVGGCGE